MQFNSFEFLWFLLVVLVLYYRLGFRNQNRMLLVASYLFYAAWDWRFVSLLFGTTFVDWWVGRRLETTNDESTRRRILVVSLLANLGVLGIFKYFEFFADSATSFAQSIGLELSDVTLRVILPVGISFYTFQSMSYTIDVFRRRMPPVQSLPDFALFVSYFPQLVAGPIERATNLMPQITKPRPIPTPERVESALALIASGLVRKVVIADVAAPIVNRIYPSAEIQDWKALVVATIAFALQIYGDFSGYSAIARGVSRLLGVELMQNFRQPYLSASITEFWQRWHISLSTWLRDYLYVPLGGNRRGARRTSINLLLVMVLGGLWHGANYTFLVWGAIHGVLLAVHRRLRPDARSTVDEPIRVRRVPAILLTFALVTLAWVFFRADSIDQAMEVFSRIATLRTGFFDAGDLLTVATLTMGTVALDVLERRFMTVAPTPARTRALGAAIGLATALLVVAGGSEVIPFIYFQF